jgi:hypothetical protein
VCGWVAGFLFRFLFLFVVVGVVSFGLLWILYSEDSCVDSQ